MRVCIFTENYYKGGLDTFLINLVNSWPNADDELSLVCNYSHPGLESIESAVVRNLQIEKYWRLFSSRFSSCQCDISCLNNRFTQLLIRISRRLLQYPILFPWYVVSLAIYFRFSNYDRLLVVNGGYPASLLCRAATIGWRLSGKDSLGVMSFHSSAIAAARFSRLFENFIDSLVVSSCSHIVSVSKKCMDTLNCRASFNGSSKVSYIYNGIVDPVRSVKPFNSSGLIHNNRYCLMLATYHPYKGHAYLLTAFKNVLEKFPDVQLKICGHANPDQKRVVADQVCKLGLGRSVHLSDFVNDTEDLLRNATVLVVPSQSYEAFGLVIVEAMAFGVPVVATDVGGIPEVLGSSNAGFVCSKDDSLEFASAIKTVLSNESLARTLGQNGRKAFESRFLASRMAASYRDLLKTV